MVYNSPVTVLIEDTHTSDQTFRLLGWSSLRRAMAWMVEYVWSTPKSRIIVGFQFPGFDRPFQRHATHQLGDEPIDLRWLLTLS